MNMHTFGILTLTFSLLALSNVQAEEIAGETEERAAGQHRRRHAAQRQDGNQRMALAAPFAKIGNL